MAIQKRNRQTNPILGHLTRALQLIPSFGNTKILLFVKSFSWMKHFSPFAPTLSIWSVQAFASCPPKLHPPQQSCSTYSQQPIPPHSKKPPGLISPPKASSQQFQVVHLSSCVEHRGALHTLIWQNTSPCHNTGPACANQAINKAHVCIPKSKPHAEKKKIAGRKSMKAIKVCRP